MKTQWLEPDALRAHNLVEQARSPGNYSDWMGVNAVISPDDDIFRFFVNHPTSVNPVRDYLSDGWRTAVELQQVLDVCDLSLGKCSSFLEFASGHGRFTRHLAKLLKPGALTVSDVVPGSVDFLKDTFGVKGFYSDTNPEQVAFTEPYALVFVLSLFSHLPEAVWTPWLKALFGALQPGGVLVFSTHGEKCARLAGVELPADGYRFFPSSESKALDGHTYGSTYSPVGFVEQRLKAALGSSVKFRVLADHFWGNQDAIVVMA